MNEIIGQGIFYLRPVRLDDREKDIPMAKYARGCKIYVH